MSMSTIILRAYTSIKMVLLSFVLRLAFEMEVEAIILFSIYLLSVYKYFIVKKKIRRRRSVEYV